MLAGVDAAGGDGVEQGLPEVGTSALHERDRGFATAAQTIAETGDEFEAGCTAADHDDAGRVRIVRAL